MRSVPIQGRIGKRPVKNIDAFNFPFQSWLLPQEGSCQNRHISSSMESSVNFFPLDVLH